MTEMAELTSQQLARAIPSRVRKRLMLGRFESGADVSALRRFVGLTQTKFAQAMGISVHTLQTGSRVAGARTDQRSLYCESRLVIRESFTKALESAA